MPLGEKRERETLEQGDKLSKNGVSAGLSFSLVLELWSVSCTVELVPAPGNRAGLWCPRAGYSVAVGHPGWAAGVIFQAKWLLFCQDNSHE